VSRETDVLIEAKPPADVDLASLPSELRVVVGQLIRRLRAQYAFGWSHASVLSRLYRDGPQFIGELAAAERVRSQSMSQTLADLEADGLIERGADADDGRRTRIAITARGREALEADRAARDGWLAGQISGFTAAEQATLHDALALMRRLAESD
jgi:DNA-binding MarR family transcriptional regulator